MRQAREEMLQSLNEHIELDEAKIAKKVPAKGGGHFIVLHRDTKGRSGQDPFLMRTLKKGKVTEYGTHVSVDRALGFAKNKGIIEARVDPADIDMDATDDDIKSADKNIMMQMRKVQSLRGNYAVEFMDGKKVKVDPKVAMAVQSKYMKMRRPAEKEMFQAKVSKSYKDMLSALKEGFEVKKKKESTLQRISQKIQERKNG